MHLRRSGLGPIDVKNALLDATKNECRSRGCEQLLMMNDRRSIPGKEFIERAGGCLSFSEHRMESYGTPPLPRKDVLLRQVGDDDATLREIELTCHDRFYPKPDQNRFLALLDGEPIGKIDVCLDGPDAELTGFVVLPRLRGKGFGKALLQTMVRSLRDEGRKDNAGCPNGQRCGALPLSYLGIPEEVHHRLLLNVTEGIDQVERQGREQ